MLIWIKISLEEARNHHIDAGVAEQQFDQVGIPVQRRKMQCRRSAFVLGVHLKHTLGKLEAIAETCSFPNMLSTAHQGQTSQLQKHPL